MADRSPPPDTAEPLSTRSTGALRDVDIVEARAALRLAQTALAALGYDVGKRGDPGKSIDGVWGERTREAVLAFQDDHNLGSSGQLDTATTAALLDTEADALDTEATLQDDGDSRDAAAQLLHAGDKESVNDVLDEIAPTNADEDLLQ